MLLQLWSEQAAEERTEDGVFNFYGWLEQNRPELLDKGQGDPYQLLKADLTDHIKDAPPRVVCTQCHKDYSYEGVGYPCEACLALVRSAGA
jgi:hypothetical protein